MESMYQAEFPTRFGKRYIAVACADITSIEESIDILGISCFYRNYVPTTRSLVGALLHNLGINVKLEAQHPEIDLRDLGHVWLSQELTEPEHIGRLAAVEMTPYGGPVDSINQGKERVLSGLRTFFQMLEMAASCGISVKSIVLPILGTGDQHMGVDFIGIPLVNECIRFLEQCESAERICIVERSPRKAYQIARTLEESYRIQDLNMPVLSCSEEAHWTNYDGSSPMKHRDIFLSYNKNDYAYTKLLCKLLEEKGMKVWYAPRDILGNDYATAIVEAIQNVDYFIPLISKNSLRSRHVLNEIDLAFNILSSERNILPIMLDEAPLIPAFRYYLSRLQWYFVKGSAENELDEFSVQIASLLSNR